MLRRLPMLLLAALIATWAIVCVPGTVLAAEPVFPKGSRVGLSPVGDLQPSKRFPGFEDVAHGVEISMLGIAAAGRRTNRAFDLCRATGRAHRGEARKLSVPERHRRPHHRPWRGKQYVKARKWFLTASTFGTSPTFILKVQVPETASAVYSEATIREMLATVTLRAPPVEEQLAMLPFKITDLAGFRTAKVVPNEGAILVDGPNDDLTKQPYAIISAGRGGPQSPDDRARFARELLASAPLRDLVVTLAEPMRIDGRPGFEVRATATGFDGKPVALVQWLRFSGGGFLRIIGAVPKENWDQFFPRFRAVRDGINTE